MKLELPRQRKRLQCFSELGREVTFKERATGLRFMHQVSEAHAKIGSLLYALLLNSSFSGDF